MPTSLLLPIVLAGLSLAPILPGQTPTQTPLQTPTQTPVQTPGQVLSTEQDLIAQLNHKPLFLRGLYAGGKLKFDASGQLTGRASTTSPMLSAVDIAETELKSGRLILKGHRQAIVFYERKLERNDMTDLSIEVASPANGDYSPALAAIFTQELSDLAPAAPDFWKRFLLNGAENLRPGNRDRQANPDPASSNTGVFRPGEGVDAPVVLAAPQPEFSDEARRLDVNGNILVRLQVDAQGKPQHLRIVRPLGGGLDEKAVEAVSHYKFRPAMKNGQPVPVDLMVEVNFRIFDRR